MDVDIIEAHHVELAAAAEPEFNDSMDDNVGDRPQFEALTAQEINVCAYHRDS